MDLDQRHTRAIKLLEDKGHKVRTSDSHHILIDGHSYHIRDELIFFVEDGYPEEWSNIEREFDEARQKKPFPR